MILCLIPTLFVLISQDGGLFVIAPPSLQTWRLHFVLFISIVLTAPANFLLSRVPITLLLFVLVREEYVGLRHAPLIQLLHRVLVDVRYLKSFAASHVVLFLVLLVAWSIHDRCVVQRVLFPLHVGSPPYHDRVRVVAVAMVLLVLLLKYSLLLPLVERLWNQESHVQIIDGMLLPPERPMAIVVLAVAVWLGNGGVVVVSVVVRLVVGVLLGVVGSEVSSLLIAIYVMHPASASYLGGRICSVGGKVN